MQIVAGIVLDERQENKFKEIGIKDSKAICKYLYSSKHIYTMFKRHPEPCL